MWNKIARLIIRYRIPLLVLIAGFTVVMGYHAQQVRMTYSAPQIIPIDNPNTPIIYISKSSLVKMAT
jgi:predicted RND superfamily exporter protein